MEKSKVMGHIFAIITILVWGSCFVLTKNLLVYFTPIQIIPLRMGLAYITLWILRPRTMKLPWKDELMFILIGITGGSFYFYLQNTALDHTYAANVSILVALSPILTVLLAQLFSRSNERLGKYVYIGAVIAIAGVVLVVLNGQLSFHLSPVGDLLALAAALMWAVYSILIKKYTEQYDNFIVPPGVPVGVPHRRAPDAADRRHARPDAAVHRREGAGQLAVPGRDGQRRVLCHLEHRLQGAGRGGHQQLPVRLPLCDGVRGLAAAG